MVWVEADSFNQMAVISVEGYSVGCLIDLDRDHIARRAETKPGNIFLICGAHLEAGALDNEDFIFPGQNLALDQELKASRITSPAGAAVSTVS